MIVRLLPTLLLVSSLFGDTFEGEALRISARISTHHLPFGTILSPMYAAPASDEIVGYTRCGDSAIWTGHYLAAESFRYAVTRSPAALNAVREALAGVQLLVDITAPDNLLARCAVRTGSPYAAGILREEEHNDSYAAKRNGVDYRWVGHTSRDQYMGVFFGLSTAYQLVDDSDVRAAAADVATRLIDRLLAKSWAVVMPGGSISTVFWLRPDQELSILQVGRQLNPSRFSALYQDLRRSATGLNTVIALETQELHDSYFKFNLDAITFFNLLRLEDSEGGRRSDYLNTYLIFRRAVEKHGNAFFNTIDLALRGPDAVRDAETTQLLSAWLLRPKRDDWVDLRGKYKSCGEDRACSPIPVAEQVRTDFLWQRSPFLLYGGGAGTIEGAGIDFILPYWMSRYYGARSALAVVSAASGRPGLAPDSLASIYGTNLTASVQVIDSQGISRQAAILYASPEQINFQVPPATLLGNAQIRLDASQLATATVEAVAPGLFAAVVQPANDVTYVILYGTGIRGRSSVGGVTVTVAGRSAPVLYAGPQPEYPGLDQVNVAVPSSVGIAAGDVSLQMSVDGKQANALTLRLP